VTLFKYLNTVLTDRNLNYDEIKNKFNLWNSCYQSIENILSYRVIAKNMNIKI